MRKYELTLVLKPTSKKETQGRLLANIKKWMGKGEIISTKDWGKRELSYPIRNEEEGIFLFLEMELEPGKGGEIERRLRLEEDVLRHLLVRSEKN